MAPGTFTITRKAAQKKGLSPVNFRTDAAGTGLFGSALPDASTYLTLSGPPGGPLFVQVKPIDPELDEFAALEKLARSMFESAREPALTFGQRADVEVDGVGRPTILFYAGQAHPLTSTAVIAIYVEDDNDCVAIVAGCGGRPDTVPDALAVAGHPSIARVLETFELGNLGVHGDEDDDASTDVDPEDADELAELMSLSDDDEDHDEDSDDHGSDEDEVVAPVHAVATGPSVAAVSAHVGAIRDAMQRAGLWSDGAIDQSKYMTMKPAQQLAFSLQASIPPVEQSLVSFTSMPVEVQGQAVDGILQMFAMWPDMLRDHAEAAELVEILEHPPTA